MPTQYNEFGPLYDELRRLPVAIIERDNVQNNINAVLRYRDLSILSGVEEDTPAYFPLTVGRHLRSEVSCNYATHDTRHHCTHIYRPYVQVETYFSVSVSIPCSNPS